MGEHTQISRRDLLRFAGSTALVLAGGGITGLLGGCSADTSAETASERAPATQEPASLDKAHIALKAVASEVTLLSGKTTRVWTYRGEVLEGDPSAVQHLPGSYLGPILRVRWGQHVRLDFTNELSEPSIVHWHGLHLPQEADGHPRLAIGAGETYTYEFEVRDRAGTYWYHPHPHTRTGQQAYYGLAGLLLVSDREESAASLPSGEYDIPLVIQDRTFDSSNQLVYLDNGMMDQMMGFLGDRILVSGQPDFVLPVATRPYRLRLLNGSNSRTYKLGWHDGTSLSVIATDGGLLEKPVQRDYVVLSPGERIELWADLTGREVGAELRLQSLPFFGGQVGAMGMMGRGGMGGASALPNGSEFTVMRVYVERETTETVELPERMSTPHFRRPEDAANHRRPRTFDITMRRMAWFLNGRTFEMEETTRNEVVTLGDLEVWEFVNQRGGMSMIHPMHVHNMQFQVIERQVLPRLADQWETVRGGYVDEGWKDSVLLMPGERVKLLLQFKDYEGLYLYHCHNLEHEDLGLMRNYRVRA